MRGALFLYLAFWGFATRRTTDPSADDTGAMLPADVAPTDAVSCSFCTNSRARITVSPERFRCCCDRRVDGTQLDPFLSGNSRV